MISDKKLEQWKQQGAKDAAQFQKDQKLLVQLQSDSKPKLRTFFEKMRAQYFNFQSEQNDKLNRLLLYTEIETELDKYPKVMNAYLTYNASSILVFAVCALAPKKMFSKIIISLVVYGLKTNIGDGIFTYYMIQNMALSGNMTQKQQELRNVLQFYYMHRLFTKKIVTNEEEKKAEEILLTIRKLNEKYSNFKKVELLF